jgi:uncharacterized protein YggE
MIKSINFRDFFVVAMSLLAMLSGTIASANEDQPYPRILVSGKGSIDIAPDMAILTLTVTREAETARAALDANSSAMNDVMKAMKAEGIEARDLQTSGFSIQPRYVYPGSKTPGERQPPQIVGYTVRNTLNIRVRDIAAVGNILDLSVSLGVNEGGNISFTNADPSAAITQARIEAVRDALTKAETLARAAGVKTGKLLEISEQSYNPGPRPMARAEMSMVRSDAAVPVAAGENTYTVNVNVSFAIDQ